MADINVTGIDLIAAVKGAYDRSRPQGLGFLHAEPGGLSDEEAQAIIDRNTSGYFVVNMDYVKGRACKFTIRKNSDGELITNARWHDHSDRQHDELLTSLGIPQDRIDEARSEPAA